MLHHLHYHNSFFATYWWPLCCFDVVVFDNRGNSTVFHDTNVGCSPCKLQVFAVNRLWANLPRNMMCVAIGFFAKLIVLPNANDETLGNLICLNPFQNYVAWETLAIILQSKGQCLSRLQSRWRYSRKIVPTKCWSILEIGRNETCCGM